MFTNYQGGSLVDSSLLPGCSPSIANVFRLYSSLVAGLTVTDMCLYSNPAPMGVNER